jgi:1-acyl-sn-glycerol-3-phosphate acyltransferase
MPPPRLIRRLLMVPLAVMLAVALTGLTPAVAALSAAFNLLRRGRAPRAPRSRLLRVTYLALAWSLGEMAAMTALLGLWIASGFGGWLDTEPYQAGHYAVMNWFLDLVYRAAQRACGLRVSVTGADSVSGPEPVSGGAGGASSGVPGDRPLIVLSRHAGAGDSLLLVHHLLSVCGRRPRVVMKATLQLDPSLDIVSNRVPNAFLRSGGKRGGRFGGERTGFRSERTEQVRRLAAGLKPGGALLIFPEGGNWTPLRWRRAIDRLRRHGHTDLAARAAAMPNVLPPREGGAFAALAACPEADVIVVAHAGLDRWVSIRDIWHSLLTDVEARATWWYVPSEDVPRDASHDAQVKWLYDWWERVDAWITDSNARASEAPEAPEAPEVPGIR